MKYCEKCGSELFDEAVICPKCGCQAGNKTTTNSSSKIQTAFVLNIIAVVISLVAVTVISVCLVSGNSGSTSNAEKSIFEMKEIKKEYEDSIKAEEKFYAGKGKDIQTKEEYKNLMQSIENCVEYGKENEAEALTNMVETKNEEEEIILEGSRITLRRAKAEKDYKAIKDGYESTCNTLRMFGVLFLLVAISFSISIVVKIKMDKDNKKKIFAWIYLISVIITDIVYTLLSFIILVYVICGIGLLIPVPPVLQTIAAIKFLQATKE